MVVSPSLAGCRVPRLEDATFLTTGATYTEDVVDPRLDDPMWVTFVRSPLAHARIRAIDTGPAERSPGCVGVVTAPMLAGLPGPPGPAGRPLLARDVTRFAGEAVAAVLTDDRYAGEDAAGRVEVDYEPLPAVVDPLAALRDEVLLFPELGTNVVRARDEDPGGPDDDPFARCEVVVSEHLRNQRLAAAPLEVRAAAVAPEPDGRVTAWIPSQGAHPPFGAQAYLAGALGLAPEEIRVVTPDVGGAFGAKFPADPEHAVVVWAARHHGRPARWVETRSESMTAMPHGRAQHHDVTIGGTRAGRILAYRLRVVQDCGAYPGPGAALPELTVAMAAGVYDIATVRTSLRSVVTTTTPVGSYRGAGLPEATAAVERAVDLFAAATGLDPAAVRRANVLPAAPVTGGTGLRYDSGDYGAALDTLLAACDYPALRRAQARRRRRGDDVQTGIGLALYVAMSGGEEGGGSFEEYASVELHDDGGASVLTGTSPHGQGHRTAWAVLVHDVTGVPPEDVAVVWGDTGVVPRGGGTGASRSLQQGGAAVRGAARAVVALAVGRAAERLEVAPSELVVDRAGRGIAVRGVPGTTVRFAELAADARLRAEWVYRADGPTFPFGAHLAVVAVDLTTGRVSLERMVALDDAGTLLNPLIAEGQRHGGLAQGVAQALYEEVRFDPDGNPTTVSLDDYQFVAATGLPGFELITSQTPAPGNPLGAKGIGEVGVVGATPAVQNAVVDAVSHLGVRHLDMPLTPLRVWTTLRAAGCR